MTVYEEGKKLIVQALDELLDKEGLTKADLAGRLGVRSDSMRFVRGKKRMFAAILIKLYLYSDDERFAPLTDREFDTLEAIQAHLDSGQELATWKKLERGESKLKKDLAAAAAVTKFLREKNWTKRLLSEILEVQPSEMSEASRGIRPSATSKAYLYLITGDERLAPERNSEAATLVAVNVAMDAMKDPLIAKALHEHIQFDESELKTVAEILNTSVSEVYWMSIGYRPSPKTLAHLYAMFEDERFEPKSDEEIGVYVKIQEAGLEKCPSTWALPRPPMVAEEELGEEELIRRSKVRLLEIARRRAIRPAMPGIPDEPKLPRTPTPATSTPAEQAEKSPAFPVFPGGLSDKPPPEEPAPPPVELPVNERAQARQSKQQEVAQRQPSPSPMETPDLNGTDVDLPPGLVPSPWFAALLSGALQIHGQEYDDLRFIVTAQAFKRLQGQVSEDEIRDTVLLIQELRRRIGLFTQLTDMTMRSRLVKALAPEITALYVAIEQGREVLPTDAGDKIRELKKTKASLMGGPTNKGNEKPR